MSDQLDDETLLNQAIRDLEPGVPVRSYVRDGDALTMHLQDGRTLTYSPRPQIPDDDLSGYLKTDLQMVAQELGVEGWKDMLKADLVQALEALRDA